MKKIISLFVLLSILLPYSQVFAQEYEVVAPKWEDYVPEKYQNPRKFSKGKSIAELAVGVVLTDLIITCPIGIPMICHATTKMKNTSYYHKKIKFENGLAEADKITNSVEKQNYYNDLLKTCDMTIEDKYKQEKKQAKKDNKNKNKEAI